LLAQEQGASIAKAGEAAVLVASIGLGDGVGSMRQGVTGEEGSVCFLIQCLGIQAEGMGEGPVEKDETWGGDRCQLPALMQEGGESSVRVVEVPAVGTGCGNG
jgi:hypothetical protein